MKIKGLKINYVQYGNKIGKDVVLLHGWSQNIRVMDPIGKRLRDTYRITILDLPGFGDSDEPYEKWFIDNYFEILDLFLRKLKIKNPIIVGHSFGGRIAILYASKRPVSRLVLLASPIRRTNKKATVKIKILKTLKKIPILSLYENYFKTKFGSSDYRSATPVMRRILVNVINNDLTKYLPKIKCPTLLIWGSNDTEAPVSEGKFIESLIEDCGLIIYEGCSHYTYLEKIDQITRVLDEFFKNS